MGSESLLQGFVFVFVFFGDVQLRTTVTASLGSA